jgi:GNAT superfamily N-acetyltransferase
LPVAFTAILAYPSGTVKNAWRGHRTVVLPEFQGLGIGVRISDAIGTIVKSFGGRYFSKTSSQRMGEYRNVSKLWKPTSKNEKKREDYSSDRINKESNYKHLHIDRVCYSHEFIGCVEP